MRAGERVVMRAVPPFKPGRFEGHVGTVERMVTKHIVLVSVDDVLEPCRSCGHPVPAVHSFGLSIVHPLQDQLEGIA